MRQIGVAVIGTGWCGGIRAETLAQHALVKSLHLAETRKLGPLEPRDHPEDPDLLAELQVVLEADHRVEIGRERVLPQLHDAERLAAGARIDEPHRLHRPEQKRLAPAPRHLLDRQASLEVADRLLEVVRRRLGRAEDRAIEPRG